MFFRQRKIKQAILQFFDHVEKEIMLFELDSETFEIIKKSLNDGYELIKHNESLIAFENLATQLIEYYIILNKAGIEIAKKVIALCRLDSKWEYDLRRIHSMGYVKGSWKLTDAVALSNECPYTFYKPSLAITAQLKIT